MKLILVIIYGVVLICNVNEMLGGTYKIAFNFMAEMPLCILITCGLHEISHLIFFKLGGIRVKTLRIGLIKVQFEEKRILLSDEGIFSGYCIAIKPKENKRIYIIIALLSGGASCIILSVVLLLLIFLNMVENISIFMLCMIIAGFINGVQSLFIPYSTDQILIKKYLKEYLLTKNQ